MPPISNSPIQNSIITQSSQPPEDLNRDNVSPASNSPIQESIITQSGLSPEDLNKENPLIVSDLVDSTEMEIDNQLPLLDSQPTATHVQPEQTNIQPQSSHSQATEEQVDVSPPQSPTNWANEVEQELTVSTNSHSSSSNSNDIRQTVSTNNHAKIIEWCNKFDLYDRSPKGAVQFIADLLKEKSERPNPHYEAIFSKIKYNDRGFFRYFTHD